MRNKSFYNVLFISVIVSFFFFFAKDKRNSSKVYITLLTDNFLIFQLLLLIGIINNNLVIIRINYDKNTKLNMNYDLKKNEKLFIKSKYSNFFSYQCKKKIGITK